MVPKFLWHCCPAGPRFLCLCPPEFQNHQTSRSRQELSQPPDLPHWFHGPKGRPPDPLCGLLCHPSDSSCHSEACRLKGSPSLPEISRLQGPLLLPPSKVPASSLHSKFPDCPSSFKPPAPSLHLVYPRFLPALLVTRPSVPSSPATRILDSLS